MHYNHPLIDQKAVHRPTNRRATARTKLEEPIAHDTRVRQAQVWSVCDQEFDDASVIGKYIDGPRLDLRQDSRVVVLDGVGHGKMLTRTLTDAVAILPGTRRRLRRLRRLDDHLDPLAALVAVEREAVGDARAGSGLL